MVERSCWDPVYIRVIKYAILTFLSRQIFVGKKLVFSVLVVVKERFNSRGRAPSGVLVDAAQEGTARCRSGLLAIRSELGVPFVLWAWRSQMGSRALQGEPKCFPCA